MGTDVVANKSLKRFVVGISIAVFVLLSAWGVYHFWGTKSKEYYWRSVEAETGSVTVLVTSTGTLNADTSVDVGVQVNGTIAKVLVDFNSVVKKGQVIAVLDTALLYSNKVDADATMQRASMQVDLSKKQFKRTQQLHDSSVLDEADYEPVLTAYQTAKGNLVSARAQLERAKINLQYATIKTPISGIVISRNIQVGNMVIASFNSPTLFTIANDLRKMQVQANVDEADIGQVKVGRSVKFTVDAFPNDVFVGSVSQVRRQPIIVTNVVNYVVIVEVLNPEMKLVPGLTANLNIYVAERDDVLKVPANAFSFNPPVEYIKIDVLISDSVRKAWVQKLRHNSELKKQEIVESLDTKGYLWVISGRDIYPIEVSKGLSDGTSMEITGNIKSGAEVVVGINQSATSTEAKKTESPFMPKFPKRKR